MRLVLYNENRVGTLVDDHHLVDVSPAVPGWDADPLSSWWVRLCRDFAEVRGELEALAERGERLAVSDIRLCAPVLNPTKVIAAAMNYAAHRDEMERRPDRSGLAWRMDFDVFLKAPSSVCGPADPVRLPVTDAEIHHECELAFVIGTGGRHIPAHDALAHVLGYTILIDVTIRGPGDRSRRKSYDTFTPIGPWLVTRDEIPDPQDLEIRLDVNGEARQHVHTADMLVGVAEIIAYASDIMTLHPGDVICTGAPPGVGKIEPGDVMTASISGIGQMPLDVQADPATTVSMPSSDPVGTP